MSQTAVLKKFQIEVVHPAKRRTIQTIDNRFRKDYQTIFQDFLEAFSPFLQQLKKTQKSVSYIQISWLRTSLFGAGPLSYSFEAYSEQWYADVEEEIMEWRYDWLGDSIQVLHQTLLEEGRKYGVLETEIRKIIYDLYPMFNRYVQEAIYHGFRNYDVASLLKGMNLGTSYVIRMGEYLDYSEKLASSPTIRNNHEKINLLKQRNTIGEDLRDTYLQGTILNHGQYSYAKFSGVNFRHNDFSESVMCNTNFYGAELEGVNFAKSIIADCQFERGILKGADFRLCKGNIADLNAEVPCLFGVNFCEADLSGADFRMAALKGANFTNAVLTGAKFLLRDRDNWPFSEKQKQAIDWHS
ncbi:pentapeptide repeat-containing protein [Listeria goaensis]|uniref:pentapeptide repeat-containing protein n=1 Tax=Listeria goaensis TaxID=1649188 RepID=UPI000B58B510|nr:pentapeptide repeat-containing protein [Listeria goaensis]